MISFANYAPDRSTFDPEVTDSLENVLPIQGGYGPFPAFRPLSQPLPERPQGSYLGYVNNGNYELYAWDCNKAVAVQHDDIGLDRCIEGGCLFHP
ncbi:hypothetical protein AB4144_44920 [Rhizobiaceae sp. 2RAB30]